MKKILLNNGMYTIIDDNIFKEISKYTWHAHKEYKIKELVYYAKTNIKINNKYKHTSMHRLIMTLSGFNIQNKKIDHKNGNRLDNQLNNLRIATSSENGMNRTKQINNSSGYKGVYLEKRTGAWYARIKINNKIMALGYFKNKIDAAKTYDIAALKYHGNFANTNFPKEQYVTASSKA